MYLLCMSFPAAVANILLLAGLLVIVVTGSVRADSNEALQSRVDVIRAHIDRDEYREAISLAEALESTGRGEKNIAVSILGGALENRARELQSAFPRVPSQNDKLPVHHKLALGQFYCFKKGDWSKGLLLLAETEHPFLKNLAINEIASPSDAPRQYQLAEDWWKYSGRGPHRVESVERAIYWFRLALDSLDGKDKATALQRIMEYEEARFRKHALVISDTLTIAEKLSLEDLDVALGLTCNEPSWASQRGQTFFHVNMPINNRSSQARIDRGVSAECWVLMVDGTGKPNVMHYKKAISIPQNGAQSIDIGSGYNKTIRQRNNNSEIPVNMFYVIQVKDVPICQGFIDVPREYPWWLDKSLVE